MSTPQEDLYLRQEYIARERTELVKPYAGPRSENDYNVTYEAGGPLFAVSG